MLHQPGETTRLQLGANQAAPGAGRCRTSIIERSGPYDDGPRLLRMLCESPAGFALVPVAIHPRGFASGSMADGPGEISSPDQTLLSPLARVQTSLRLYRLPRDAAHDKLAVTPDFVKGWQVTDFDLRDIRLGDYEVHWAP